MGWQVWLTETTSGNVIEDLHPATGSRWADGPLNDGGETRTVLAREDYRRVAEWAGTPFAAAIVPLWNGTPVAWSPITKPPEQTTAFGPVALTGGSIWDLLAKRLVTVKDFGQHHGDELRRSAVTISDRNLGGIVQEILRLAQQRPNGALPLTFGSDPETGTAKRTRTYEGFNIANISAAKLIREITQVINGPDVRFRPVLRPGRRVGLVVEHGIETQPVIAQHTLPAIDLTAPRPETGAPTLSAEWSPLNRLYASGAGEGAGTLISPVDSTSLPASGRGTWLEDVWSDTDTENWDLLDEKAKGRLEASRHKTVQLSVLLPNDNPTTPLNSIRLGDRVRVRWPDGWVNLTSGVYEMTVLKISGDYTSTYTIEFQSQEV